MSSKPIDTAIETLQAEMAEERDGESYEDRAARASLVAIRVAIMSERQRCKKICHDNLLEYKSRSETWAKEGHAEYVTGYRDGSEDCMQAISMADEDDINDAVNVVFPSPLEKKPEPDPELLTTVFAQEFEQEGDEETVWLE